VKERGFFSGFQGGSQLVKRKPFGVSTVPLAFIWKSTELEDRLTTDQCNIKSKTINLEESFGGSCWCADTGAQCLLCELFRTSLANPS
jgi:hypothetical protein